MDVHILLTVDIVVVVVVVVVIEGINIGDSHRPAISELDR